MSEVPSDHNRGTTYFPKKGDLSRPDAVVNLGRKLADSLESEDLLGRWMSHHIAELLTAADSAPADSKDVADRRVMDSIMALWSRRRSLPGTTRPYELFDPVIAALARLNPASEPSRFYSYFEQHERPTDATLETAPLLRAAVEMDVTSRDIIKGLIIMAAREAVEREQPWLEVAEGLEKDEDERTIWAILEDLEITTPPPQDPHSDLPDTSSEPVEHADANSEARLIGRRTPIVPASEEERLRSAIARAIDKLTGLQNVLDNVQRPSEERDGQPSGSAIYPPGDAGS